MDMPADADMSEMSTLVARVAALTGESVTEAVTAALRERLVRLEKCDGCDGDVEALLAIGRECAARLPASLRTIDHGNLLYDDRGLPR